MNVPLPKPSCFEPKLNLSHKYLSIIYNIQKILFLRIKAINKSHTTIEHAIEWQATFFIRIYVIILHKQ
jgi:hypothetical protein